MRARRADLVMAPATEMVALEDVERRVLRAIRTLAVLPDRESGWHRVRANWPETMVEWSDLLARAENPDNDKPPPRFEPTKRDVDDCLIAGGWYAALRDTRARRGKRGRGLTEDQRIIRMVAFEWSFEAIAGEINRHHDTVRLRYRNAIRQCWRLANVDALARARDAAEQHFRAVRPSAAPGASEAGVGTAGAYRHRGARRRG